MKELLKNIKLLDHWTTELEIQKAEFVSKLKEHVDEGGIDLFSESFDVFISSKNEYKGHVGYDGFKIKRRRKFFDMQMNLAVASGTYRQQGSKLIIETEINGFRGRMIPFLVFMIIFYTAFIVVFLNIDHFEGDGVEFAIPFILLHAAFMLGIPYFMIRRSTKRLKHDLEREFYYMTKK